MPKTIVTHFNQSILMFSWIFALILSLITFSSAFQNNAPTCEHYVRNTYLYLSSGITYTIAFMSTLITLNILPRSFPSPISAIVAFVVFLVAYYGTFMALLFLNHKHVLVKHTFALFFVFLSAILFAMIYQIYGLYDMIQVFIITIVIFMTLSFFAFKFQDSISSKFTSTFFIIFLVGLLAEMLLYVLMPFSPLTMLVTLGIMLLIVYIAMKHTKRMIENQKTCKEQDGPDYIREALSFFVDFKNIFVRLLALRK